MWFLPCATGTPHYPGKSITGQWSRLTAYRIFQSIAHKSSQAQRVQNRTLISTHLLLTGTTIHPGSWRCPYLLSWYPVSPPAFPHPSRPPYPHWCWLHSSRFLFSFLNELVNSRALFSFLLCFFQMRLGKVSFSFFGQKIVNFSFLSRILSIQTFCRSEFL